MEDGPTCIGYARFKSGLDAVEQFTSPSSVEDTLKDFQIVSDVTSARVIAFVPGSKHASLKQKLAIRVKHMAFIEDEEGNCTHRDGVGACVEATSIRKLMDDYIDERDLYFALYLAVRQSTD